MSITRLRIILLTAIMWSCAGNALAKQLVVDRAIFEDVTGVMSLAQVKGAAFEATPEVISKQFSRSAFWLRLSVEVPVAAGLLAVRIRPNLLDSATLYYPAAGGGPEIALDMSERLAQKNARIELKPGLNTVYLRAESIGSMLIMAQVMTQESAVEQDVDFSLELGAVLAIYALLTIGMVGLIVMRRSKLAVFFFFHLLVCLVIYVLVFGFLDNYPDIDWLVGKTATRFTAITNFLSFCLLMQSAMGHIGMLRLQRLTRFASAGFVLLMVLFFVVDQHLVLKFSSIFGALTTTGLLVFMVWMCFRFLNNKSVSISSRLIIIFMVAAFVTIVSRSMLQVMGVIAGGDFLLQSPAWRGVFIPTMLLAFLWQRDRELSQKLVQGQIDMAMAEVRLKDKTLNLKTQSEFMAMLMHEIKTPLYTIQIACASLRRHMAANDPENKRLNNIEHASDNINFIIDRCQQANQIDQGDLPVNKTPVALNTLLLDIKLINGYERVSFFGIEQANLMTDFHYARIILANLITNALKYSPPGSQVQLRVQEAPMTGGRGLNIRVSNTVGVSGRPDPLKIFDRYYRAEGAKNETGAGLGLWLAKSIATKLGCELRLSGDDALVHFDFSLELS